MHHRTPSRNSAGHLPRRDPPPRPEQDPRFSPSSMQPSLPPIHHLHQYLAPAPMPAYAPEQPALEGSSTTVDARRDSRDLGPADSDTEEQGPPKKKRRRQALSCTECKRRKIKCDRAQPCGPCARRGEANKCQWNIVEPTDKYVSRAEYDELKSRLDHLEASMARLLPDFATSAGPAIGPAPYMSAPGPNIPHSSTSAAYHPQYAPEVATAASEYHLQSHHRARLHLPLPPLQAPASPAAAPKPSPLSLAAITTPYEHPPPPPPPPGQPKNYQAQTLTALLGERLRLSPPDDPVQHRLSHQYRQLLQVQVHNG